MIKYLSARRKRIAVFCCAVFLFELLCPPAAFALTSGPSQPEMQSFQQAGTNDMVDLFSGDFSYNIPLFELPGPNGGYPFNLAYQAGIGMDQEASWVGLGWNLSPGVVTRQMRGLPDEFKGDAVTTRMSIEPSVTVGLGAGGALELFGGDASLGVGFSVSFNNYKYFGYSIDGSLGYGRASETTGRSAGVGLDFSLDSNEGISMQPSLSLGGKIGEFGLSAGYNSNSGLHSTSLSQSRGQSIPGKTAKDKNGIRKSRTVDTKMASSAYLSLAHPGYTPQISMPMKNLNLSAEFRPGGSWWGVFGNLYVKGFYNEQRLDKDKRDVTAGAYGYMHYQDASGNKSLLDVNREKDGVVTKESPNLAIPSLTYDLYSVAGQGISAMYRPMRNDYGIIRDQEVTSVSVGGSVGVDLGPAASHIGVNLSFNHARSTSGPWKDDDDVAGRMTFQTHKVNDLYEPWYFQVHGAPHVEPAETFSKLDGDKAVRVQLYKNLVGDVDATPNIERHGADPIPAPSSADENRTRKSRNQVIQTFTNEQIRNADALPQFRIEYLNGLATPQTAQTVDRQVAGRGHHIGAITATTPEGLRYNYALPAYNLHQEEVTFTAKQPNGQLSRVPVNREGNSGDPVHDYGGTEKFLRSTTLPPYAHSHLLTSILGTDYVDLNNDGITPDDLGYWVKFTYRKATPDAPYKWREPFSGAHYQAGWKTDPRDDKGSFTYGEKELWYLAQAETKSHVAIFEIETRNDGKGVLYKLQDTDQTSGSVYRLNQIRLHTRAASNTISALPLKVIKLQYDYSLCRKMYNQAGEGKLTLKKVWFEYGGSLRGSLNPYTFTYSSVNPDYDINAYDRWGSYKPYPAGAFDHNRDFPYVVQDPSAKEQLDANTAAWSLTKIDLPSGGEINVDYETDDYGYVQHKPAMQMMEIVNPGSFAAGNFLLNDQNHKVRFKLEETIPEASASTPELRRAEALRYLDMDSRQLYFKILVNLRKQGEGFYEYVSGYVTIHDDPNDLSSIGLEREGTQGPYTHGYFHVVKEEGNNHLYHPFSLRVWQHLRANQPELTNSGKTLEPTNDQGERVKQIRSLGSVGTQLRKMFQGFYDFCNNKQWGREIVAGKSWVRLRSPDRIKYGGGLRVRQITMRDKWEEDKEGVYGQVYEYKIKEDENEISSGVAAFEPVPGNEENPLRYAKKYVQSPPLVADNILFFEYPVNEACYPGAHVGYRKVTVWSLASAALAGIPVNHTTLPAPSNGQLFPTGPGASFGTTGKTEHEFYTAKDFPVITEETGKVNKMQKFAIPVPFLGNIAISKLTASQGYSIITNDMHGKPRKVSNYRQDKSGRAEPEPISWVSYDYLSETIDYQNSQVSVLLNTMRDNGDNTLSIPLGGDSAPKYVVGQETEFFADMREFEDKAWSGGARFNTDIIYIPIVFAVVPIPVPTVWPSVSKTENRLRTAVTNKVIFKSGILRSTTAYDGGSRVETRNEKWDKLTGAPVLTVVNNNFDAPIYSYNILAYQQYEGMGAAYQNIGLVFDISSVTAHAYKKGYYDFYTALPEGILYPGDELILYEKLENGITPVAKAVYTGNTEGDHLLHTTQELQLRNYQCLIARSGYRNQLSAPAGTITALQDPTVKGSTFTYPKTITIVK